MNTSYDYLAKIVTLGESLVGKSSIIMRYTEDKFSHVTVTTLGFDMKTKFISNDNKTTKLLIFDTAG